MELWDDISTEKMNALYCKMQNAKCKGARAEHRVSLERYAERRMLSTNVKCKGVRAETSEGRDERTAGGYFLRFSRLAIYTLTPKTLPA